MADTGRTRVPPAIRKFILAAHLTASVGWVGAAAAYLVVGGTAEASGDGATIRAAWIAMELVGWYVIVPLAIASVVSGIVIAVTTQWGLFRHYWVIFSFGLTLFAAAVLLLHMPSVTATADLARGATSAELVRLGGDIEHPAIGLALLLVILGLNVYKPRGVTPRGRRTRRRTADTTRVDGRVP